MGRAYLGIDIGNATLKLAACLDGTLQRVITVAMPAGWVVDGRVRAAEAVAQLIRRTVQEAGLPQRRCAVVLPETLAFTRTISMPAMRHEEVMTNLPYEFRDFLEHGKENYVFDYAVTHVEDEAGQPAQLELVAATTRKKTIARYAELCRRAGLRMAIALPEDMGLFHLIVRNPQPQPEVCIIDLGHTSTRLHFYHGKSLRVVRVVEQGLAQLETAVAQHFQVDGATARRYVMDNHQDVLTLPAAMAVYAGISTEVMRAINFYHFHDPTSNLTQIFLCGGGAQIPALTERLSADLQVDTRLVCELMGLHHSPEATLCPAAIGAATQG